jgi:hypothetical protein
MTLEDVGPDNWRHCAALEVEMTLLIYPVVVGQGTRLFPDTGPDTALDLDQPAVIGPGPLPATWQQPCLATPHDTPCRLGSQANAPAPLETTMAVACGFATSNDGPPVEWSLGEHRR